MKYRVETRPSVFNRITKAKESSNPSLKEQKDSVFSRLGDGNEVQSSIPSRMNRFSTPDVKIDGSLRVKRHTMIFTGQQSTSDSNKKGEQDEVASSHHIIGQECEDLDSEMELTETPKTLEDGGQATVDDLKELNLGTTEEPRPIYISSLLTSEEESRYFNLLSEYKDVFAWRLKYRLSSSDVGSELI